MDHEADIVRRRLAEARAGRVAETHEGQRGLGRQRTPEQDAGGRPRDRRHVRHGEAEKVVRLFRGHHDIPLVHRDASGLFLGRLTGVTDPEVKRKTIGGLFVDVFEKEAASPPACA